MSHLLQSDSQYIEVSGNSKLVLDKPGDIYQVSTEYVDVFAVPLQDGRPNGARTHLFRAYEGALLFGLDTDEYEGKMGLIVSGKPGSGLFKASRTRVEELSQSENQESRAEIRELIGDWIINLTHSLDQGVLPRKAGVMAPGEMGLEAGEQAYPQAEQKLVWIKITEGELQLFSESRWSLSAENGYFPLSKSAWIEAKTPCRFDCLDKEQYQRIDPAYQALEDFHAHFLLFLADKQRVSAERERQRMARAGENDRLTMGLALNQLAETMSSGKERSAAEQVAGDELLNACKLVGEKSGLQVQAPPPEARINTDPLEAIAKGSNFRIRQVALQDHWWRLDSGPMLGFRIDPQTEEKHPVALLQMSPGKYILKDPGTGKSQKVDKRLNQELDMFAYSFYRPLPNRPLKARDLLSHGLFKTRRDQLMLVLMGIASALLALFTPVATGRVFGTIIPEADRFALLYIGVILFSAALATAVFEVTKATAMMRLVGRMDSSLQSGVMDRLLSLGTPFFRRFSAGDLAERTLGINAIRQTLSGVTIDALLSGIFSVFSLLLLFYYSVELALIALVLTLAAVVILALIGYLQVCYQRKAHHLQGRLSGLVLQLISGVSKLRVSGTEDRAFAAWAREFSEMRKVTFKAGDISNYLQAFTLVLPVISILVLFGYIALTPLIQEISVGHIIAFNSAFTQFQTALIQMSQSLVSSLDVVPLYERAKPILEAVPEVDASKAGPGELSGQIEVNNLHFRYDQDGPQILKDISLQVDPGEFAAIVGGSGGGKSTLLRLLLGFESPESGTIYYDGQDLSGLDVVAVRRQLGVVLQNGSIMAGDIFSNIVGSSSLTQDDAWEAARMAGLDQDIQSMPMGMHTMVPAGGGTLSGGQCQRLLIARAIVHKPRIIYFDEATSALDNKTQKTVSQSLEGLNATRVVIAHRLSTIIHADKIFVLDKGSLVQKGSYQELMQQSGLFAELARRQLA
jgi:ATP-binding cassette subfamily C protein